MIRAARPDSLPAATDRFVAVEASAGAIDSAYQFHWKRFLFEHFPKGTGFPPLQAPAIKDTLPLAGVQALKAALG